MERMHKIMIAVDQSSASLDTVAYVGHLMGGRKELSIRLFHVLAPMPPRLLEFGGSEDPQQEERLSAELHHGQQRWIEAAKQAAKESMDRAVTLLIDQGFSAGQLSAKVSLSIYGSDIPQHILDTAHEWDCGTIVVGRHTLPWLQELFVRHVGEEVVHKAEHCAVWVVGPSRPSSGSGGFP